MLSSAGGWEWEVRTRADSVEQFLETQQWQQKWPEQGQQESGTELENSDMTSIEEDGALVPLPTLREAICDPIRQRKLFVQKLRQCQKMLDFGDPMKQKQEKEVKADALKELNEFVAIGRNSALLANEEIGTELFKTMECNLFRVLPPSAYSPQWSESNSEDLLGSSPSSSLFLEPAWPHLQLVYRLLRQLIDRLSAEQLDPFISDYFCLNALELLRSADSREREKARQIVHGIYTKLTERRTGIRKQMANILLSHTFESMPFNGLEELLQILGDIINGFNVPLKEEHRQFLFRVLLPLHKSPALPMFFSKLAYCVMLFVEKDVSLAKPVIKSLLRNWPSKSGIREILFITELDEILSQVGEDQFRVIMKPLVGRLVRCTTSQNARLAERALLLWKSPKMLTFLKDHSQLAFPEAIRAIDKAQRHWSSGVIAMSAKTMDALRMALTEADKQKQRR
ncbi:hypothetical protein niasHS_013228 [Heterodera schachtii]|uniref:Serine/threonine protein phosphatase 2A regulatory subunit n=1 Tax=Heterodera schachtii TaxID=97005 RepID=A0ABD2IA61_HETSC